MLVLPLPPKAAVLSAITLLVMFTVCCDRFGLTLTKARPPPVGEPAMLPPEPPKELLPSTCTRLKLTSPLAVSRAPPPDRPPLPPSPPLARFERRLASVRLKLPPSMRNPPPWPLPAWPPALPPMAALLNATTCCKLAVPNWKDAAPARPSACWPVPSVPEPDVLPPWPTLL